MCESIIIGWGTLVKVYSPIPSTAAISVARRSAAETSATKSQISIVSEFLVVQARCAVQFYLRYLMTRSSSSSSLDLSTRSFASSHSIIMVMLAP